MVEQGIARVLSQKDVARITGKSPTTLWRWERAGKFPQRLRLSSGSVGWLEEDVRSWLTSLPRGMCCR